MTLSRSLQKLLEWKRRSKPPKPGRPIKRRNRARREREWARAYHSIERVEWVRSRPCKVLGCENPAENMHIKTGGMGRKADYADIADICREHHEESHRGIKTFQRTHRIILRYVADDLQRDWEGVKHEFGFGEEELKAS